MQDMNDILNPPTEEKETQLEEKETQLEVKHVESEESESVSQEEGQQVTDDTQDPAEKDPAVKAELAALAKERDRLRQKEADLEKERLRLAEQNEAGRVELQKHDQKEKPDEDQKSLRELKAERRQLEKDLILDPSDEAATKRLEELEEMIEEEEYRLVEAKVLKRLETDSAQTKSIQDLDEVLSKTFEAYPFLHHKHPDSNAELNADIVAYKKGLMAEGKSEAEALQSAVNKFVPLYKVKIRVDTATAGSSEDDKSADQLVREKLGKGGFTEVRSASNRQVNGYNGPTPMSEILKAKPG